MQVLIENPNAPFLNKPKVLIPSFWSPSMFFMGPEFSMTSLIDLSDPLGLSPFLSVDVKVAFLISQIESGVSVFAKNMGALGVVALQFSSTTVSHHEDRKRLEQYYREYLPAGKRVIAPEFDEYDQVVVFGESKINPDLWSKLKIGGHYIFGAIEKLEFPAESFFEAKGKLWPFGEATEFGWRFQEETLGLPEFEFAKLQKRC